MACITKRIKISRGKVALVDIEDFERINKFSWSAIPKKNTYYARTNGSRKQKPRKSFSMHRLVLNYSGNQYVDHINGNGLDNRKCNLRLATPSQNKQNSVKRKTGTSKHKGVIYNKFRKKWQARIQLNHKRIDLGCFDIEKDAVKAYNNKSKELFKRFHKGESKMDKKQVIEFMREQVVNEGKSPDYDIEYSKLEAAGFKVSEEDSQGGEGQGEHFHTVMKFEKEGETPFFVMCEAAYYMSYDGVTWDGGRVYEAKPVEIKKTAWKQVK